MLQMMFHEATACHVTAELIDLLNIFAELIKSPKIQHRSMSSSLKSGNGNETNSASTSSTSSSMSLKPEMAPEATSNCGTAPISGPKPGNAGSNTGKGPDWRHILARWKDMGEMATRLLTLCNSFVPSELRDVCLMCVKEMLMLWPNEMLTILVPLLHRSHNSSTDSSDTVALGPFFPRKNMQPMGNLKTVRPPRPMFQMSVPSSQIEGHNGQDPDYDRALFRYFDPYHRLVDLMVRLAVNEENLSKPLVDLSAMVGLDGVPLHFQLFPKLWIDIFNTKQIDRKFIMMLVTSHGFLEYVDAVLLDERSSLNNSHVFNFLLNFFPKVCDQVLTDQVQGIISHLVGNFIESAASFNLSLINTLKQLNGDLRALILVSSTRGELLTQALMEALKTLKTRVEIQQSKETDEKSAENSSVSSCDSTSNPDSQPPPKVAKTSNDQDSTTSNVTSGKNKWKDMLLNFLHTLNLLIGMCENALNTKEDTDTPVESSESESIRDENKKSASAAGNEEDSAKISKSPTSVSGEKSADENETLEETNDKKDNDKNNEKSETLQDDKGENKDTSMSN